MKGYWDGVLFFVLVGLFTVTVGSFLNKLTEYGSLGAAFEAWELRDWKEVLVSLGGVLLFSLAFGWVPVRFIWSRRQKKGD
jgi:flagellar biogenesis protein FliO